MAGYLEIRMEMKRGIKSNIRTLVESFGHFVVVRCDNFTTKPLTSALLKHVTLTVVIDF